jgi:hypothetical protein
VARRRGGAAAPADAPSRQLLALLLGLDLALLILHVGTEAAFAVLGGARLGAAPSTSSDHSLLGAAAPIQLLAFAALALLAAPRGAAWAPPRDRIAAFAATVLALADVADLTARLATAAATMTGSPSAMPIAKLATAGGVAVLVAAPLLLRSGGAGPLGRIVLRLTLGLGATAVLLDAAVPLMLRDALPRSIFDGAEELAEAAIASWALAAGWRTMLRPAYLS